jgi:hypothetical protein
MAGGKQVDAWGKLCKPHPLALGFSQGAVFDFSYPGQPRRYAQ